MQQPHSGVANSENGRQYHSGRRRDEIGAMVLAHAEDVEPHLVGQDGGFDDILQPLLGRNEVAGGRVNSALGKGEDAEFKGWRYCGRLVHSSLKIGIAQSRKPRSGGFKPPAVVIISGSLLIPDQP